MYIVTIDVGLKNLGFLVYDMTSKRVLVWSNECMVTGKYMPSCNVQYVRAFVQKWSQYFENAHKIIVERQMRCNMRIIESVFEAMFYETVMTVAPRSVKVHFGISKNNYRCNKQAAIEYVSDCKNLEELDLTEVSEALKCKKKDDLADSMLLLLYYLHTYNF